MKVYAYSLPSGEQGILPSWAECDRKVSGIPGARFRKFSSTTEARAWLDDGAPISQLPGKPIRREWEPRSSGSSGPFRVQLLFSFSGSHSRWMASCSSGSIYPSFSSTARSPSAAISLLVSLAKDFAILDPDLSRASQAALLNLPSSPWQP